MASEKKPPLPLWIRVSIIVAAVTLVIIAGFCGDVPSCVAEHFSQEVAK